MKREEQSKDKQN